jgi:hypothetical protein
MGNGFHGLKSGFMEVSTSKVIVDALVMPWMGVALRHEVVCGRGD